MKTLSLAVLAITTILGLGCTDIGNQPSGSPSPSPDMIGKVQQKLVGTPLWPKLAQSDFNAMHVASYSSGNKCFVKNSVCWYFALVQDGSETAAKWEAVAAADLSTASAWGIDQGTYDVISEGSWFASGVGSLVNYVEFEGSYYKFRAVRNTSDGLNRMEAVCVLDC